VYSAGTVVYDPVDPRKPRGLTATIAGPSDVRVRASGRVAGDALIVTLGTNVPTGLTRLREEQVTAVRVLAAPALALGAPPVGAGGSATVGLLSAQRVGSGSWAVAGGVSYELHDSYTPIAALVAGAPTTDFRPGDVVRFSVGADGLVGRQRVSLSVAGDFFGVDHVRATGGGGVVTADETQVVRPVARVRLGPVLSSDAQVHLAAPNVREAVVWLSSRWRSRFARDGVQVQGSSGEYLDGGVRVLAPLARRTDLLLAADARWHSGLAFDDALLTASAAAGGVTAALSHHFGALTVQPFARGQLGRVRATRDAATPLIGGAVGLTALTRF